MELVVAFLKIDSSPDPASPSLPPNLFQNNVSLVNLTYAAAIHYNWYVRLVIYATLNAKLLDCRRTLCNSMKTFDSFV